MELLLKNHKHKDDFNNDFMAISYDNLVGEELDLTKGKYNELLTKEEVLEHPAWLTAVEEDRDLLKTYADIVFSEMKDNKQMAFWTRETTEEDELRALFVGILSGDSVADGILYGSASFLRVAQINPRPKGGVIR